MKRSKFERYLRQHGCSLVREGSSHSIFENAATGKATTVPRHPDIDRKLVKIICQQLEIPAPAGD